MFHFTPISTAGTSAPPGAAANSEVNIEIHLLVWAILIYGVWGHYHSFMKQRWVPNVLQGPLWMCGSDPVLRAMWAEMCEYAGWTYLIQRPFASSLYFLPLWIICSGALLLCSCLLFDKVAITYQQLPHVVKSPSTPTLLLWSTCVPVVVSTSTQAVLKHRFEALYVSISCFFFTSTHTLPQRQILHFLFHYIYFYFDFTY